MPVPRWDSLGSRHRELRGIDFCRDSTAPESSAYRSKERKRELRPDLTYRLSVPLSPLNPR